MKTLEPHLNAHLAGTLQGQVPDEWLRGHGKAKCRVCGLCVAASRGVHPTCRAEERAQTQPDASGGGSADRPPGPGQTPADHLPPLGSVYSHKARTLKHVPKAARGLWAQALVRCLVAVVAYNSVEAWTELAMLPKAVLLPPPRGGHQHARATAAYTTDRLTRWLDGDRRGLWSEVLNAPALPKPKAASKSNQLSRAKALAREGLDRKACAALVSCGLCEEDSATAQLLEPLHPRGLAPP